MFRIVVSASLGALCAMAAQTCYAANARTWISGKGIDQAGCGPIASPCRSLQYAHDNTAANGEIDVLDSAGYGAVAIAKGIAIVADGLIAGVLAPAGWNAITINAPATDMVVLRGLTIEGANVGNNGIVFNSGAGLIVDRCSIQNFATAAPNGNGILLAPSPVNRLILGSVHCFR